MYIMDLCEKKPNSLTPPPPPPKLTTKFKTTIAKKVTLKRGAIQKPSIYISNQTRALTKAINKMCLK